MNASLEIPASEIKNCVMCGKAANQLALNGEPLCIYHGAINKLIQDGKNHKR
jgi:hypothetical protein